MIPMNNQPPPPPASRSSLSSHLSDLSLRPQQAQTIKILNNNCLQIGHARHIDFITDTDPLSTKKNQLLSNDITLCWSRSSNVLMSLSQIPSYHSKD